MMGTGRILASPWNRDQVSLLYKPNFMDDRALGYCGRKPNASMGLRKSLIPRAWDTNIRPFSSQYFTDKETKLQKGSIM